MYQRVYAPRVGQAAAVTESPALDVKKVGTSLLTLAVLGSAAYVGIQAGRNAKKPAQKTVGWVGGVGSAILGLAAVAGLVNQPKVTSTLLLPFNLPQA